MLDHAEDAAHDFDRRTDPAIIADLKARSAPELFDFRRNWDLVLPHLHAAPVKSALDAGMNELMEELWGPGFPWKPKEGPWTMSPKFEFWRNRMQDWEEESNWKWEWEPPAGLEWPESWESDPRLWDELEELQGEAHSEALEAAWRKRGAPRPNTPDWYLCVGGCHQMAPFAAALGRLVYPQLRWSVVRGVNHSVAWGRLLDGPDAGIFFDILNYETMDGEEIKGFVLKQPNHPEHVE